VTYLNATFGTLSSSAYAANYLFQGERLDTAVNQYITWKRVYLPTLQRWANPDPSGYKAGDNNLYRAEGDGPISSRDPSGLRVTQDGGEAFAPATSGPSRPATGWFGDDFWDDVYFVFKLTSPSVFPAVDAALTHPYAEPTIGAVDGFFAGWGSKLCFGDSFTGARAKVYGNTATVNHGGQAFDTGELVGYIHGVCLVLGGLNSLYNGAVAGGGAATVSGGGAAAVAVPAAGHIAVVAEGAGAVAVGGNAANMTGGNFPDDPDPLGGGPTETYDNPADAIGDIHGKAKRVGSGPTRNPYWRAHGYTDTHYYVDSDGVKHTVFYNPKTGMYSGAHPSSGQP
jgi:RHS repeat-associated protein